MPKMYFKQKCIAVGIYNPIEYLVKKYQNGMSCNEISEYLHMKYNISITDKGIADKIKTKIPLRTKKEGFKNAIKRGRMIYYKKPEHEKYKSGGLSHKTRYEILKKNNYTCEMCGNSPKTGYSILIHHKDYNGKNNSKDNLQVLCYQCHRGLHYSKRD